MSDGPGSSGQRSYPSTQAVLEKQSDVEEKQLLRSLGFKLRHVGVAVPSLGPTTDMLSTLFGYRVIAGPFDDPIQRVSVNFLTTADDDIAEIELIAPLTEDSPIKATLAKGGGAAYHLCFETADLDRALKHAVDHKCIIVSRPAPAVAFGGRRIAWIYTPARQLFELVEAQPVG